MNCICPHCKNEFEKQSNYVNRAKKIGAPLYCSKACSGLARRKEITPEQFKANKKIYDEQYRAKNRALLKAKKHEYFIKTYDPKEAAVKRKERMPKHVEYFRRPEYKAKKVEYDKQHRAEKFFGEFAECHILINQINNAITAKADKADLRTIQGTNNKSKRRKRQWLRLLKNLPQLT